MLNLTYHSGRFAGHFNIQIDGKLYRYTPSMKERARIAAGMLSDVNQEINQPDMEWCNE